MDPSALELAGGFDFRPRTRIVFGAGALRHLGSIARELGARRALVVTDPGVLAAGHVARAEASLRDAGIELARFAEVREDPTTLDVERCLAVARSHAPDLFVALGGGSSIDTAKGADFLLANGGAMRDYHGAGKARVPLLPIVAIPTTAGTGSEVQSFALVAREEDHGKMACGDPSAAPRVAILDPELTATAPRRVVACTGMDAIGHAVEAAVTRARSAISDLFAREAFRLANRALPRALEPSPDLEARGDMLRAACFAGLAIEQSMLGAAHSLANPLSAHFGIAHGRAVGLMLPHVVRFNAADGAVALHYRDLAAAANLCAADEAPARAAALLAERLEDLLALCGLAAPLRELGVDRASLDALAQEAATQWTASFNPRSVGADELRALYEAALDAGTRTDRDGARE